MSYFFISGEEKARQEPEIVLDDGTTDDQNMRLKETKLNRKSSVASVMFKDEHKKRRSTIMRDHRKVSRLSQILVFDSQNQRFESHS